MGYFDSSKNRALWDIELQNLKKLRAERAAGKHVVIEQILSKQMSGREPVRMTYQDLLKEEAAASQKSPKRERQVSMEASKEKQKENLNKEARAYERV